MKREKKANRSSYYKLRHDKGLMWYRRGGNFSRRGTEAATDVVAPRVVNFKMFQGPHTTCHTGIAGHGEYHNIIFTNDVRTN